VIIKPLFGDANLYTRDRSRQERSAQEQELHGCWDTSRRKGVARKQREREKAGAKKEREKGKRRGKESEKGKTNEEKGKREKKERRRAEATTKEEKEAKRNAGEVFSHF